jgi:hypothetical protein
LAPRGWFEPKKGRLVMKIEHSVVIEQPIEKVFAYLADAEKNPIWQAGVLEVEKITEGDIGQGTMIREVRKFLGQRIDATYEITEYKLNSKLTSKTTSGPIPVTLSTTFETVEGGTRVSIVSEGETGGFFKLAEPIVSRTFVRLLEADFESLKVILEAEA